MGLYTQTVRGLHHAPYATQVEVHMLKLGIDIKLSDAEKVKIERVQRFLDARQCAEEIDTARQRVGRTFGS